jgi:hypothetical protein
MHTQCRHWSDTCPEAANPPLGKRVRDLVGTEPDGVATCGLESHLGPFRAIATSPILSPAGTSTSLIPMPFMDCTAK